MNIELFFCCVVGAEGDDQYVRPAGQHLSHRQRGQLGRGEDEGLQEEEAGRRPGPGRTTKVIFYFFFNSADLQEIQRGPDQVRKYRNTWMILKNGNCYFNSYGT